MQDAAIEITAPDYFNPLITNPFVADGNVEEEKTAAVVDFIVRQDDHRLCLAIFIGLRGATVSRPERIRLSRIFGAIQLRTGGIL